jgi:hypothetical protein
VLSHDVRIRFRRGIMTRSLQRWNNQLSSIGLWDDPCSAYLLPPSICTHNTTRQITDQLSHLASAQPLRNERASPKPMPPPSVTTQEEQGSRPSSERLKGIFNYQSL